MTQFTSKQLAAQAEIKLGRLGRDAYTERNVRAILADYPTDAVRSLMCEHMKFAGIFRAGHLLADWCFAELRSREASTTQAAE